MAINAGIALQGKGVTLDDPVERYSQMQQLMAGQDTQRMNAMKMQEAEREIKKTNAMNKIYGESLNPETGRPDSNMLMKNMAAAGLGSGIPGVVKQEQENLKTQGEIDKTRLGNQKSKQEFIAQGLRDMSHRPSDAQLTAYAEDLAESTDFSDAEKAPMMASINRLLSMPYDERKPFMESQGASAGERMQQGTATANREQTAATALAGQQSTAATALAGQNVTRRGQDMTAGTAATQGDLNRAVKEQKPMTALQQQSFRKAKAGDTVSVRAAETTVSELERLTDSLVGNPEKGIAPHPGLGGATGYSGLLYSLPKGEARKAEQQLETFKGKIMAFGRQLASQEGKLGNMAVQEWKFVSDAIQKIDPSAGNLDEQMHDVVRQAKNAAATIREKYDLTYEDTGAESPTDRAAPMQPADKQALEWANTNAGDPRAEQIKQRLGR